MITTGLSQLTVHFLLIIILMSMAISPRRKPPVLRAKTPNGFINFSWGTDKFSSDASFTDIGKNFNPEMGFLQWNDIRRYTVKLTASPRPNLFNTRQTYLSYELEYITDHNNQLQYRIIEPTIYNMFNDESYIFVGLGNYYDRVQFPFPLGSTLIQPGIYKYNVFVVSYGSDLSRKFAAIVQGGAGSFYNGEYQSVGLYTYLRPDDRFAIDLNWEWNRVDVPFPNGKFTTSILGARINYSFTTDLFAKAYIQWNDVEKKSSVISWCDIDINPAATSILFIMKNPIREGNLERQTEL